MNPINVLLNSKNWQGFKNNLGLLSEKQKGDCFEALTKYYLLLNPKYKTQLKSVWYLREVPSQLKKYLNLPEPDEGIDLIAESKDKTYWAIQCKYKEDETHSLTRRALSTFTDLSFNICRNIELGLVCTSADRFSHKLKLYGERLSFCAGDVWRELNEEFFSALHCHLRGAAVTLKAYRPLPHQQSAIHNAFKHFVKEKQDRGKLIMPCGTGKSLAGYWIAEKLKAEKILVAVPSLALIRQTLEVWSREAVAKNRNINWIAVCSDETVGDIERDDVVVLTQDLGVRVHTDSNEIAQWLKFPRKGTTVVFTTYQSGRAISDASRKAQFSFDVGILDEAHKTVGKKDSLFSHLLDDKNIAIKKRIFMTATERRYLGSSDQIASMNDSALYGETFELLSFKKALESSPPILSDYKILTIMVTHDEISSLIKDNIFVKPDRGKWDKDVEAEMLASVIALRKAMQKNLIHHAVSFHSSIARARAYKSTQDNFSSSLPMFETLETFHVSGNTPTAVRSKEIDAFASAKRSLITNARCLTEGVDVPRIDCVLFADPKRSTVDIVQAVGRALRVFKGKKFGYIVIPVVVDNTIEGQRLKAKAFESILIVLRALAANDERIIEYFRGISQGRRISGKTAIIDINITEGTEIDTENFINSIKLQFWTRLAKLSWKPFGEARAIVRSLGLKSNTEWSQYCKGEPKRKRKKPDDIPADPSTVYKDKGWLSWGNWLGTGTIATHLREYRSFEEARAFVRSLVLEDTTEWFQYCKGELKGKRRKPDDIPADPYRVYKDKGWLSMGDWLGTGTIASQLRECRSFEEARAFVRSSGLKGQTEWRQYCKGELKGKRKKPDNIPTNPHTVYKDSGWLSMGDWLGTGTIATHRREYRSFKEARAFVRSLGLKNGTEWSQYCKGELREKRKKPDDIPAGPYRVYKDKGWLSMGDWLGTGTIAPRLREYRSFKEARAFVRKLGLKSNKEWVQYLKGELKGKRKKPDDIPADPYRVYKDKGWLSMGDWLGTGTIAPRLREYRSFKEARAFVRKLGLKAQTEWVQYYKGELKGKRKKPDDIPSNPPTVYKDSGWLSWGNWLGTGTISTQLREYRSFKEARAFVRSLGLKGQTEWFQYRKGELKGKRKKPDDIPSNPSTVYKDSGWLSWGNWLGNFKQ